MENSEPHAIQSFEFPGLLFFDPPVDTARNSKFDKTVHLTDVLRKDNYVYILRKENLAFWFITKTTLALDKSGIML